MRRVTIKDIARIAGVSYATVSRALSGSSEISQATRERILKICKQEGYRANILARSLISSRTNVLGLIIPDVTNPFYSELALGIETFARSAGYNVMLCNSRHERGRTEELFEFLVGHQVDGIILASSRNEAHSLVDQYFKTIPTVLLGGSVTDDACASVNAVSVDNRAGGSMGAEYLHRLGHRDILYLGLRPDSITHQLRFHGFERAMQQFGLPVHLLENPADSSSIGAGYALGKQLFSRPFSHTAIFAATDSLALGVMQAADEFGIRIPEQVSLLGFDNTVYSSLPKIALSTIDQRKQLLAESAVHLLLNIISSPQSDAFVRKLVRPALVERSSCRAVK